MASLAVGLNPFCLECMSFKFDSPYMALATLCTILPFLFIKRLPLFFITSVLFLLCMWNTYQANNGIYIVLSMFVVLNFILQKTNLKKIFKFIFTSTFAFATALIIYRFYFMDFGDASPYTKIITKTITSFDELLLNINRFLYYIDTWIGTHIIRNLFFITCILFLIIKAINSKINPVSAIIYSGIFVFIGFFAGFGLFYIFSHLNLEPRTFLSIGVFVAILLISIEKSKIKSLNIFTKIFIFIFAYNLMITSTTFANAAIIQAQYVDFRINTAINYIENNFSNKDFKFQISNTNISHFATHGKRLSENNNIGFHPTVLNMINYLPLIGNTATYGEWFSKIHDTKNIITTKCAQKNQKPIKITETNFNKFEVFENDCIVITYKKIPVKAFDIKFEKSMIKYKKNIFKEKSIDGLELIVSKDIRKIDYGIYGLIFEFNQDISQFTNAISFNLKIKNTSDIEIYKKSIDYIKIDDKFYYIIGLANANLDDIETIDISFNNYHTNFLFSMKETK